MVRSLAAGDEVEGDDADHDEATTPMRAMVAGSSKRAMPVAAVPTAPIPVQTA